MSSRCTRAWAPSRPSEWDALLAAQAHPTPFMRHAYLHALEASGSVGGDTGWQPVTLTVRQRDGRRAGGRRVRVPEDAFVRRVRVRLGLGRRLPPIRGAVLPQAAGGGAVHAGARARACSRGTRGARALLLRALGALARETGCSSVHLLFGDEADYARRARRRLDDAPGRAVPLAQPPRRGARPTPARPSCCPTPTSPTSWPACSATSARRSRRSAAASARPASRSRRWRARGIDAGRLGLLPRLLPQHLRRAPLDALPHARLLRAHAGRRCPSTG